MHMGKMYSIAHWEPEDKGSLFNLLFAISIPQWQWLFFTVK